MVEVIMAERSAVEEGVVGATVGVIMDTQFAAEVLARYGLRTRP